MAKTAKRSQDEPTTKERGGWLSFWLILVMAHGVFFTFLIWSILKPKDDASSPLFLWILLLLSVADVVAAVAVWFWKKWGLQLYAISTVVGIALGLVITASQLIVFHDIVPLAVLGYLIKDKWHYFD